MTARTILTALLGLALGLHLRLQEPRQLADTAEHALGWLCRMTYTDTHSGRAQAKPAELPTAAKATGSDAPAISRAGIPQGAGQSSVTLFLRMLGLPRLRATPVELRP